VRSPLSKEENNAKIKAIPAASSGVFYSIGISKFVTRKIINQLFKNSFKNM
jgi:hypothetical protein